MPKPMGTSSMGSKFFLMASQMKNRPTASITKLPNWALAKPVSCQNCSRLL